MLFLYLTALGLANAQPCVNTYGPGLHRIFDAEGIPKDRGFLLSVPPGLPQGIRLPLMVDVHGFSESPYYQEKLLKLGVALDKFKWIGAVPFGTATKETKWCCPAGCEGECCERGDTLDKSNPCSFNAGSCCGAAQSGKVDDVAFIKSMVAWLEKNMCVAKEDVFATGFSNGGMMSHRLGCEAADVFRAIAPSGGNLRLGNGFTACRPTKAVSYLNTCGSRDGCARDLEATAKAWAERSKCDGTASPTYTSETTKCFAFQNCEDRNGFVEYCSIIGMGHEWPGNERPDGTSPAQPATNIDATDYIFNRFSTLVSSGRVFPTNDTKAII